MPPPKANSGGRADSGFYNPDIVPVCRKTKVRFSTTVRKHSCVGNLIEAISRGYRMSGGVDCRIGGY